MTVKSMAVIYDDRDKNNAGWFVRGFDAARAEDSSNDFETTRNMPRRRDAWKAAVRAARREMRAEGHQIAPGSEVRVYYSIHRDLPDITTTT